MNLIERKKSKTCTGSKVLYIAAAVAGVIAIALLVDNIILFKNNVAQYVAQGYPSAEVLKQLIPAQLLPGIFEPLALYLGIAFVLWGLGIINQKISTCLTMASKDDLSLDNAQEFVLEKSHFTIEDAPESSDTLEQVQAPADNNTDQK